MTLSQWWSEGADARGFCLIAGTTASGKSALALALAERTGGVIVNADSVQLYRSLPLLTAQPTAADRARAEHRLYGILADDEPSSVARWLDLAAAAIRDVQPRLAIVTGGTGFYLDALLHGLPDVPATPPELRAQSEARLAALGQEAFARALAARDPRLAERGLPVDRQRLLRAWEVLELAGRSIASFGDADRRRPELPPWRGGLALVPPPAVTAARIERRFDAMLAAGVIAEVAAWRARATAASPLAKADGVREIAGYLDGRWSLAEARRATIVKVRRYAKRQRTWLRHRLGEVDVVDATGDALVRDALAG
ncbi:MAG: tRNA (adenosine(37)-N6)-dimethylallyltransferase MiaA [Alphaproteobacteria bacterium]